MANVKPELLDTFFQQVESQVQFGDSKATLLVAGNAILLGVNAELIKWSSGCGSDTFTVGCMVPSASLILAISAAVLLVISLAFALLAARPASIHFDPRPELFLLSHIAAMEPQEFVKQYTESPPDYVFNEALKTVHGKASFAARKFRLLKHAVDATLLSLGFMVAAPIVAMAIA